MPIRKTKEQFIADARKVHGYRYDYSRVDYKNNKLPLIIICPTHGEFEQRGDMHLQGHGCPKCKPSQKTKLVFGVGINDSSEKVCNKDGTLGASYRHWYNMLARCYNKKTKKDAPSYEKCVVCYEWLTYSNFKEWFDKHYVEGWELDKDILIKGNKTYSPSTCCFVPREINSLFTKHTRGRGKCPIGVYYTTRGWQRKYIAALCIDGVRRGIGSFFTPEEAFQAYKIAKEAYIKKVANKWKDMLEDKVYKAMCNYCVEITD